MRRYIDDLAADVDYDVTIQLDCRFEPGMWVVSTGDGDMTVTALTGEVGADGHVYFGYPKGILRRTTGTWGVQERYVPGAFPLRTDAEKSWAAVPPAIREFISDAYLLTRHDIPQHIEDRA